jgi:1-deoxy-D-xylulose-5-phosphate reductoisomerase
MRKITILGATGSVGQSTIKVLQAQEEKFNIQAITANSNVELLAQQAVSLNAKRAVIADEQYYGALKDALAGTGVEVAAGEAAIVEAANMPADWIMAAIVGMAGLKPIMAAIKQGTIVAIANKEPLVSAGPFVMAAVEKYGATLLPIDSEHNAVFQVFEPDNKSSIERIILTASGGPFREMSALDMANVTPKQALAHPNWDMGAKISIDSATMMNKALEVIEAQRLFDVTPNQIEVLVHPQSVVHSMVEYCDGSVLAQLGASDMCTPITNVLGYPKRLKTPGEKLDFTKMSKLEFHAPDLTRFPFVKMAYDCLDKGLYACITMNAANEVAVAAFLNHKIAFLDIYSLVSTALDNSEETQLNSLNDVIEYDSFVRRITDSLIREKI